MSKKAETCLHRFIPQLKCLDCLCNTNASGNWLLYSESHAGQMHDTTTATVYELSVPGKQMQLAAAILYTTTFQSAKPHP
jgi:hypothetical protein